jgi:hypothetical protein
MYFKKWYRLVGLFSICLAYSIYKYYNKVKKEKQYKEKTNISSTLPEEMSKLKDDVLTKKPDLMTIDRPLYYRVFIYGVLKPLLYSGLFYILDLWWYTMQWY